MKAGLNKIKIAIISMIVLAMAIGQLELFGKVYAEELEKIKEQDPYGEYYDENINNVHKTSAQIIEKGIPEHKIFGDSFSFVLISSHFFNGLFFNNRRQMFIK